jgi:hypothetical protein
MEALVGRMGFKSLQMKANTVLQGEIIANE